MGDIAENFSREEFACLCGCGFDTVDAMLLKILVAVRDHFGKRVTINSACRCLTHNRNIGSDDDSQHPKAKAADFTVAETAPEKVVTFLNNSEFSDVIGVGLYDTFTHVDSRGHRARWDYRSRK